MITAIVTAIPVRGLGAKVPRPTTRSPDFSRWLRHVIRDDGLADVVRDVEGRRPLECQLDSVRQDILAAIEARYLG
jgi:hypothetical protein